MKKVRMLLDEYACKWGSWNAAGGMLSTQGAEGEVSSRRGSRLQMALPQHSDWILCIFICINPQIEMRGLLTKPGL